RCRCRAHASAVRYSGTVHRAKQCCQRSAPCTFGHGRQAVEHGAGPIAKSGIEGKDALDAGAQEKMRIE
ncbi:hypothetical protein, partial [Mesorhizobium sp. M8A.F.Ca.ET.142.01.1.1]|uniref:hypothetical protein n=1 Tax=Mesorhizobium sp. M8A.F.Ca.ET.142.01.1.1 TaxID=2563958 RepID=UPI001AEE313B